MAYFMYYFKWYYAFWVWLFYVIRDDLEEKLINQNNYASFIFCIRRQGRDNGQCSRMDHHRSHSTLQFYYTLKFHCLVGIASSLVLNNTKCVHGLTKLPPWLPPQYKTKRPVWRKERGEIDLSKNKKIPLPSYLFLFYWSVWSILLFRNV